MKDPKSTYRSTIWQHRLISFFRNIDFTGFRKLSLLLPKWLLPKVDKVGEHILKIPSGLKLWINPSKDLGVERSLFETGTYERGTLNFIEKHLQKERVPLTGVMLPSNRIIHVQTQECSSFTKNTW